MPDLARQAITSSFELVSQLAFGASNRVRIAAVCCFHVRSAADSTLRQKKLKHR